ncbi:hypothetical protein PA7_42840 [Pseudonocardia asaccharolytica DSM 44247 = NBRC 16224]|uniref:Uncharacterized protein n=1 Tax=Pseudonocardia asaccharolytica DSM 44247 = NBRC 16224 TaxID=1123024 RepID=A0A511D744_9PSEU|nr:hypothetical protein PA7_42840 [Pseudonocardia asaccharolytica DSM 44247 = NBRC 16224]
MLDQLADLVDQVCGEHDRAGVLGVVGQQPVVEQLAGNGVQAEIGLVEEGQRAREANLMITPTAESCPGTAS